MLLQTLLQHCSHYCSHHCNCLQLFLLVSLHEQLQPCRHCCDSLLQVLQQCSLTADPLQHLVCLWPPGGFRHTQLVLHVVPAWSDPCHPAWKRQYLLGNGISCHQVAQGIACWVLTTLVTQPRRQYLLGNGNTCHPGCARHCLLGACIPGTQAKAPHCSRYCSHHYIFTAALEPSCCHSCCLLHLDLSGSSHLVTRIFRQIQDFTSMNNIFSPSDLCRPPAYQAHTCLFEAFQA